MNLRFLLCFVPNSNIEFEELQGNIIADNFEKEYTLKEKNYWRVYEMKKRL